MEIGTVMKFEDLLSTLEIGEYLTVCHVSGPGFGLLEKITRITDDEFTREKVDWNGS